MPSYGLSQTDQIPHISAASVTGYAGTNHPATTEMPFVEHADPIPAFATNSVVDGWFVPSYGLSQTVP